MWYYHYINQSKIDMVSWCERLMYVVHLCFVLYHHVSGFFDARAWTRYMLKDKLTNVSFITKDSGASSKALTYVPVYNIENVAFLNLMWHLLFGTVLRLKSPIHVILNAASDHEYMVFVYRTRDGHKSVHVSCRGGTEGGNQRCVSVTDVIYANVLESTGVIDVTPHVKELMTASQKPLPIHVYCMLLKHIYGIKITNEKDCKLQVMDGNVFLEQVYRNEESL